MSEEIRASPCVVGYSLTSAHARMQVGVMGHPRMNVKATSADVSRPNDSTPPSTHVFMTELLKVGSRASKDIVVFGRVSRARVTNTLNSSPARNTAGRTIVHTKAWRSL